MPLKFIDFSSPDYLKCIIVDRTFTNSKILLPNICLFFHYELLFVFFLVIVRLVHVQHSLSAMTSYSYLWNCPYKYSSKIGSAGLGIWRSSYCSSALYDVTWKATAAPMTRYKPLVWGLVEDIARLFVICIPLIVQSVFTVLMVHESLLLFHFLFHYLDSEVLFNRPAFTILQYKGNQILFADVPGYCESSSQNSYHCLPLLLPCNAPDSNNMYLAQSTTSHRGFGFMPMRCRYLWNTSYWQNNRVRWKVSCLCRRLI